MFRKFTLVLGLLISSSASATLIDRDEVKTFIEEMSAKHGFSVTDLDNVFSEVTILNSVLEAISRPAEGLPWYKYRPIFLGEDRIRLGVKFWEENAQLLSRAEQEFGVPAEIIVAIIGVETRYGTHKGNYKVIDSLVTLAFDYPKRSAFFRQELEQFLLLAREQKLDPLTVTGSYAGAMGIPQFISSSYRNYAVDFDNDGYIDIWENPADAIGSVANYFRTHGWETGEKIIIPAKVSGNKYITLLEKGMKPDITPAEALQRGIKPVRPLGKDEMLALLEYELENDKEYWLGLKNFYVITRYNHSTLYAMAVYQLAQEIKSRKN